MAYWHDKIQPTLLSLKPYIHISETMSSGPFSTAPLVCLSLVEAFSVTRSKKEGKRCPARDKCSPLPAFFLVCFGFVFCFFWGGLILKQFCFMTANKTDKNDTMTQWVEHKGARCCLSLKELLFQFASTRENIQPCLLERRRNGRDYFPSFGSADIYGACTHVSRRDGQFAQMVAILGQHPNEKRERGKNGISVSLGVRL